MVMHARSGGIYEIMGLMQGKIDIANRTLWVMDAFALPVQGTETRVNAQNEAYEYMVEYLESSKQVSRERSGDERKANDVLSLTLAHAGWKA